MSFAMTYWTWLIVGLILLGLELMLPVVFFLWLGVSAFVTAALVFVFPEIGWQIQLVGFSILSLLSVGISRKYFVKAQSQSEIPNLNQRAQQYIGRTAILSEPIRQGIGKVNIDDSQWQATGPNLNKGTVVKITAVEGSLFTVEAVE